MARRWPIYLTPFDGGYLSVASFGTTIYRVDSKLKVAAQPFAALSGAGALAGMVWLDKPPT